MTSFAANLSLLAQVFNPANWYWIADDGRIFASGRSASVPATDPAFLSWKAAGNAPTAWPRDASGAQTDAALSAVLSPYGLSVPGQTPIPVSVTKAQAKIQLLRTPSATAGKTLLDDATAAVQAKGGETAIWFSDAQVWNRASSYVASLGQSLGLSSAQIDALFVSAAKISA